MKNRLIRAAALCSLVLVTGSCRKEPARETVDARPVAVIAPQLLTNQLGGLPGAVYQSQQQSAIHWQPWTKESLQRAKEAQRLVFAVVVMPQYPFQQVLGALERQPEVAAAINHDFVPVLIDGDASREMSLLAAELCGEIQRPAQFPLFVWMSYDGNPVAWIPVSSHDDSGVIELYHHSQTMVAQMWDESPEYVLKNSSLDNASRRQRLAQRKNSKVMSEQPAADAIHAIRQLVSLYDPSSRSFDEIGGLFPSGVIELLANASGQPGIPADVRARALETTRDLMTDLLPSPMFDPLDGGVFTGRRGTTSWALPTFRRDCPAEARAASALLQAYRATGEPRVLEKALAAIAFAERSYGTSDRLFAVGMAQETAPELWMWRIEDIERELGPTDAAWWIKATAMKGLGNLPSEADPEREYFRSNSLGMVQTVAEIAAGQGVSVEAFAPRLAAARQKLLAARNARLGQPVRDDAAHAGATFRMVSVYATAFEVTGDAQWRDKAVALLGRARENFSVGPRLRVFAKATPESVGAARAFIYGLALQAAIDVAMITSDESWLIWSEDLATTAAELFASNDFLNECPDDAKLIDVPVTDLVMLFDESTAGMISSAESRLAPLGRPLVASFSSLATPLPTFALERPVLHSDLLVASLARHYGVSALCGSDLPAALQLATQQLPLRTAVHRPAKPAEQVPAGAVKVIAGRGEGQVVTTAPALREAALLLPPK